MVRNEEKEMTPQERLSYLLETVTEPTNAQVTFAIIEAAVGFAAANLVAGTIQAATAQMPLLATVMTAMSTPAGLSFSSPQRQAIIDDLAAAGNWPDSIKNAVKALGYRTRTRWQIAGYASEPTLESVTVEAVAENIRIAQRRNEIIRGSMISAIQQLDAVLVVGDGEPPNLDDVLVSIRSQLIAFGTWA